MKTKAIKPEKTDVLTKRGTVKQKQDEHSSSSYFKKHTDFVCRFCNPKTKKAARSKLLQSAKPSQVYAICECIRNVVNCQCPVDDATIKKLTKFEKPLTELSKPKRALSVEKRKRVLSQRGAGIFLPLILSSVASYLIDRARKA